MPRLLLAVLLGFSALPLVFADDAALKSALTFHASFDRGLEADFAKGDPKLYTWIDRGKNLSKAGLHTDHKSDLSPDGKFGKAMRFLVGDAPWIYYAAQDNLAYHKTNWSGSVSLWLKCDPVDGLAKGYCDPIQLTPRAWNDAAFFLDFNKDGKPRDFRLGAFADKKTWNPQGGEIPESKRPLLTAMDPQFGADQWTHVLFTWEGFNTGRKDAVAKLYLDGTLNGTLTGWNQIFTWAPDESPRLLLGLHYVGLLDEFSCFSRALSAEEVKRVHSLAMGVTSLLK
jgi:hypothetical protein